MLVNAQTQARLNEYHPAAASELLNLQATLEGSTLNPDLLALCQAYFSAELSGEPWSPAAPLNAHEVACIAICEQFMVSVASVSDVHVARLAEHFSPDEIYNLMYAIYLIEASERLTLTLQGVLQ